MDEKIKEYNDRLMRFLSIYLNNGNFCIDRKMVKDFSKEFNITDKESYKYLLASFIGLDIDDSDRELFDMYFKYIPVKQSMFKYENDLYYKNIKIDDISDHNWNFKIMKYKAYEPFVFNDLKKLANGMIIPSIGYFEKDYEYLCVLENNREWMLITPNEINTMKKPIKNATGKVLTYGLGLGYFAYHAHLKNDVSKVTIVENNKEVIDMFKAYILPKFDYKDKIEIINCDAIKYNKNISKEEYDYVFIDIWHDPSDGIELYKMFKNEEKKGIKYDYWIENTIKLYL